MKPSTAQRSAMMSLAAASRCRRKRVTKRLQARHAMVQFVSFQIAMCSTSHERRTLASLPGKGNSDEDMGGSLMPIGHAALLPSLPSLFPVIRSRALPALAAAAVCSLQATRQVISAHLHQHLHLRLHLHLPALASWMLCSLAPSSSQGVGTPLPAGATPAAGPKAAEPPRLPPPDATHACLQLSKISKNKITRSLACMTCFPGAHSW